MNSNIKQELNEITDCIISLNKPDEIKNFMLEIFTEAELETLSKRWQILGLLNKNYTQREISNKLKVSLCKVTRGAKILKNKDSVISKYLMKGNYNGKV